MKANILVGVIVLGLAGQNLHGATLTVTSTADNGAGTLRAALATAADGDTIDATGVTGTILLTSGELLIYRNNVNLVGPGPDKLAIDGNSASRVFHVQLRTAAISGLTITNGVLAGSVNAQRGGAGVLNQDGTLTISNCIVTGNSAFSPGRGGGIENYGMGAILTVVNCKINKNLAFNYGGGIYNDGYFSRASLVIVDSILEENTAGGNSGGGIYNDGRFGTATITMTNSTLSGNSTQFGGGGIGNDSGNVWIHGSTLSANTSFFSPGGGIANDAGAVVIANSTLSGNDPNDIYNHNLAELWVRNSSVSSSSNIYYSGILNDRSTASVGSTILNSSSPGVSISNYFGNVTSLGYNLSSDNGGGLLNNSSDLINTDPLLGPLQDNGGPTWTHALLPGSPAIDRGFNFSGSATDQRDTGFARTVDDPFVPNSLGGDGTDIGAYEVQQAAPPPDSDGDGVLDAVDSCPSTPAGSPVDEHGCSIDQLVPCAGPTSGGRWKNHGEYVSNIARTAARFVATGRLNERQSESIVNTAARSECGKR